MADKSEERRQREEELREEFQDALNEIADTDGLNENVKRQVDESIEAEAEQKAIHLENFFENNIFNILDELQNRIDTIEKQLGIK